MPEMRSLVNDVLAFKVVLGQLVNSELLGSAGAKFISPAARFSTKSKGHLDQCDLSDLASVSAHMALVLHRYLGQSRFVDETL